MIDICSVKVRWNRSDFSDRLRSTWEKFNIHFINSFKSFKISLYINHRSILTSLNLCKPMNYSKQYYHMLCFKKRAFLPHNKIISISTNQLKIARRCIIFMTLIILWQWMSMMYRLYSINIIEAYLPLDLESISLIIDRVVSIFNTLIKIDRFFFDISRHFDWLYIDHLFLYRFFLESIAFWCLLLNYENTTLHENE